MSIHQAETHIPEWTLGDRMRKAMEDADLRPAQIGEYLGVARNTVSTWIHDRVRPDQKTLMLWALRTGVPYEWLERGDQAPFRSGLNPTVDTHECHSPTCVTAGTTRADWALAS